MKFLKTLSILLLFTYVIIGCKENEDNYNDCVDLYFVNNPTLVEYTNQNLLTTCNFFVKTKVIKENLYFYNDCYCADMILKLVDCNSKEASQHIYESFSDNYDSIKIIGYYP